jgi:hypothetical protein
MDRKTFRTITLAGIVRQMNERCSARLVQLATAGKNATLKLDRQVVSRS